MARIIAFAGSNSSKSINHQLVTYTGSLLPDHDVRFLRITDYELPIYGVDLEAEIGIPKPALLFLDELNTADGIILSLAEHNGAYTAAFKNLYDWASRKQKQVWGGKPMFLMASSPGKRGGLNVFTLAQNSFPHMGANIVAKFSLPNFYDNFKEGKIIDGTLREAHAEQLKLFKSEI